MTTAPVRRPPYDPEPAMPDAPLAQQARAARVDWLRRIARF